MVILVIALTKATTTAAITLSISLRLNELSSVNNKYTREWMGYSFFVSHKDKSKLCIQGVQLMPSYTGASKQHLDVVNNTLM